MDTRGDIDPEWRRDRPGKRMFRTDAIIAVVLFAGAVVSVWLYARTGIDKHPAPVWICLAWAALTTIPLVWRRRYPVAVTVIVGAAFMTGQLLSVPETLFGNITFFLAFYSIGAWTASRTVALLSRIFIVATIFIWLFCSLILNAGNSTMLSTAGALSPYLAYGLISIITNLLYFGAAYYFGERAYNAARERSALEFRTAELAAAREHAAAQAVVLERVRIARELHDVVAHHVSVMGVQAAAARRVLTANPAQASASLSSVEVSARTAVEELHLLLSALRSEGIGSGNGSGISGGTISDSSEEPATSTSTRGLRQLQSLADDSTAGGVAVRYTTIGHERPVSATIGLSAYRIAQEALTNTRKHGGPGAQSELRLRYLDGALEIEVSDDGAGSAAHAPPGERGFIPSHGMGLIGMRERVAAVGGTLEVGPKARGGYLVRALFPTTKPGER